MTLCLFVQDTIRSAISPNIFFHVRHLLSQFCVTTMHSTQKKERERPIDGCLLHFFPSKKIEKSDIYFKLSTITPTITQKILVYSAKNLHANVRLFPPKYFLDRTFNTCGKLYFFPQKKSSIWSPLPNKKPELFGLEKNLCLLSDWLLFPTNNCFSICPGKSQQMLLH